MINKRTILHNCTAKLLLFATVVLLICAFAGCSVSHTSPISKTDFTLNTVVTITVYNEDEAALAEKCIAMCRDYERIFSRTNVSSELAQLNIQGSARCSDDLLHVINTALHYCEVSDGRFDITTGKLSDMYKFATEEPAVPSASDIEAELAHVGYKNIKVNGNIVTLGDPLAEADLGAIAKGYIADRLKDYLVENGVEHAIINLGGNVLCVGGRPDGNPFTVDIQYPFKDQSEKIATLSIDDLSVVTSGIYERCFESGGRLYHHILDPATGYPYDNGLVSVSVVGPCSEDCDALSTTLFSMGLDEGLALIDSLPEYSAVFITEDLQLHYSEGFEALLKK